mgnify:CR=1 FL=1
MVASPPMSRRRVFYAELGQWFAQLREERGLGQSAAASLARRRGHPEATRAKIVGLETGETKHPSPELLRGLAAAYGVAYERLVRQCVIVEYSVDISSEAPLPAGARVLSFEQAQWLRRFERLTEADRDQVTKLAARMLGSEADSVEEFQPADHVERRIGKKDRRVG